MTVYPITMSIIQRMQPGDFVWDSDTPGFGVRKSFSGAAFYVKFRVGGRQRFLAIGKLGSPWTVETAQQEAQRIRFAALSGVDERERRHAKICLEMTLATASQEFLLYHRPYIKQATFQSYERALRLHVLPRLGDRRLEGVDGADIRKMHSALADRPRLANLTIAIVSKLFNWAREHKHLPPTATNPCEFVQRFSEQRREYILSNDEIARLGATMREELASPDPHYLVHAIWFILFTGVRKSEILRLRRDHTDVQRLIAVLVDSKTGKKTIALNQEAIDILRAIPVRDDSPFYFSPEIRKLNSRTINRVWERVRTKANLPALRLHDLRHNFATLSIESGMAPSALQKQLGHSTPGMTARYTHVRDDQLKVSMARAGSAILRITLPSSARDSDGQLGPVPPRVALHK